MTAKRQSEICEGYSFSEEETLIFPAIKSFTAPLPDRQEGSLEFLSQEIFSAPVPVIQPSTEISDSRKRRKVMDPEALTAIIRQAAMEATEANKMSFGSIVQGHLQTMKIEILTEVDVKLSPIAERVAKLETEWKSAGGGGGGGGGGGSSNASTFVPKNSEYKPTYLEIRGFVTNWKTNEGSLDEGEAHAYITRLFAGLPRSA